MKQIGSFMSEISDEFKTVVVEAIQSVCIKFPRKHHVLMSFLSSMAREEGGFEYKKAIVNTIVTIVEENPEAKEAGRSSQSCDAWVDHVMRSCDGSCDLVMCSSHVMMVGGWVGRSCDEIMQCEWVI